MLISNRTGARWLAALAVIAGVFLALPASARAGAFRAALCDPDVRAFHAGAAFARNSRRYLAEASCGLGGRGMVVSRAPGRVHAGTWGAWVVRAPAGTSIVGLSVKAAARRRAGDLPELLVGPAANPAPFANPDAALARFRWTGPRAGEFAARLRCRLPGGCPRAGGRLRFKRLTLVLNDAVPPRLGLGGSLFEPGSRRGIRRVAPTATDVGGGIRRFLIQVNGQPVSARAVDCRLARDVAIRLRPCPSHASARFAAATTAPPFRQGPNVVRVCAADHATTTAANRSCAARRVRVDNLCPVSDVGGGSSLRARMRRHRGSAAIAGRLLGVRGRPVSGARLCVATRVRMRGAAERVALAPITGADGRFRAQLRPGPSRDVRVAYWPSPAGALERYLDLRVPARPLLRLRPRHPVRNGRRVRFEALLPGPGNAGRRVRVQARSGRRWVDVRAGITGRAGAFRASYRFRATTGRRRYRFRAVVPKQRGYPYEAGVSRARRVTVIG